MADKKVTIILGAKDQTKQAFAQVDKGLKGLGVSNKMLAAAAVAAAGATATAYLGLVKQMSEVGDNFDKMSQRTGVAVEDLSRLAYSAELGGSSMEAVEKGIKKLSVSMYDAERGSKEYVDAFRELGIQTTDAAGQLRPVSDVIVDLADSLNAVDSDTKRAALAQKLLGRAGTELLPMLKQGSAAIRQQGVELQYLGGVVDSEFSTASAELVDATTRVNKAWDGLKMSLTGPAIKSAADDLTSLALVVADLRRNMGGDGASAIKFGFIEGLSNALPGFRAIVAAYMAKANELRTQMNALEFGQGVDLVPRPLLPGIELDIRRAGELADEIEYINEIAGLRAKEIGNMSSSPPVAPDPAPVTWEDAPEDLLLGAEDSFSSLTDGEVADLMIALDQMKTPIEEIGDAASDMGRQIGSAFADAAIQMALFGGDANQLAKQLFSMGLRIAIGGLFSQGGAVPMAQGGSIPHAAFGYSVPDGPRGLDSRLIAAMPGEEVINRQLSMRLNRFLSSAESSPPPGLMGGSMGGSVTLTTSLPVRRSDAILVARGVKNAMRDLERGVL